ncbi:MAG: cytochrome c biogenesis protein CcsA [Chthonomonadales bacterium]|nr:cytochrome c biogenesis protein CcsA [Chthonomonadales bacterium]
MGWIWKTATGFLMAGTVWGMMAYVRPAEGFLYPDGARIIIIHVPCAWISAVAYLVAAWNAGRVLKRVARPQDETWVRPDCLCEASMELGLLFSILTTATGSIFSRLQWGAFWSWDPRQTSIVVIMLLFAAYLVLRSSVTNAVMRARLTSAYAIIAVVPGMFLIWVLPRVVASLHGDANNAVIGGGLDSQYRAVLYGLALPAFVGLYTWLMQLRMRLSMAEWRAVERSVG